MSTASRMTPEQKLKWAILLKAAYLYDTEKPVVTDDNVDALYAELVEQRLHFEPRDEVRQSGINSGLDRTVDFRVSRYFEHREVAAKMPDGSWVGWTFLHGGGKHSEPAAVEWMADAYALDHRQETKTVIIHKFTMASPEPTT